ncbi:glucan biosynthesis protein [Gilvimarinus xylanilyticus]|uniref:Glucans biosynthesis protein G n=1 Tax=Gilvimarinus xylanilyticus TaxID=2944139 RepID=A0A9X2I4C5_9GAMM|nr:glucan biosynthesis protein G [Gilvimarinus xylanilyticus]MCP8899212.1 glucan biosynthesis protein [Gilvimarinus xylanilyticus]
MNQSSRKFRDAQPSARPTLASGVLYALLFFTCLILSAVSLPGAAQTTSKDAPNVVFAIVKERAAKLAEQAYQQPNYQVPQALSEMNYEQYRSIHFRREAGLWQHDSLFEVQFFHPGFYYNEPVNITTVDRSGTHARIPFKPEFFRYGDQAKSVADAVNKDLGYAGFRVHYPLNEADRKSEFMVFQGATYFRIVGPGQVYGISARGLAIDTAETSGEEFPVFRDFWLIQPDEKQTNLTVIALMDSPSISGAYRFTLKPGAPTKVDVDAALYPRTDIHKVGVAPLTSMFFHGENSTTYVDDIRPEIHDSDGLLLQSADDSWVWRPLSNPKTLRVSSLQQTNPKGFGLLQRDRDFNSYLDAEAHYAERPSLWVTPKGDWGEGRVEIVEIPTDSETNDNIVAYWVPGQPLKPKREHLFSYQLRTFEDRLPEQTLAQVERTRIGWAAIPGQEEGPPRAHRKFAIDFSGGELTNISAEAELEAQTTVSGGEITDVVVQSLPALGTWRIAFTLIPEGETPADMQVSLSMRDQQLSEVWSYVWYSDAIE